MSVTKLYILTEFDYIKSKKLHYDSVQWQRWCHYKIVTCLAASQVKTVDDTTYSCESKKF